MQLSTGTAVISCCQHVISDDSQTTPRQSSRQPLAIEVPSSVLDDQSMSCITCNNDSMHKSRMRIKIIIMHRHCFPSRLMGMPRKGRK